MAGIAPAISAVQPPALATRALNGKASGNVWEVFHALIASRPALAFVRRDLVPNRPALGRLRSRDPRHELGRAHGGLREAGARVRAQERPPRRAGARPLHGHGAGGDPEPAPA